MTIGVAYGEDTQKEKEGCTMVLPPYLPYLSEGSLSCPSLFSELSPLFLALWTLPALFPGSLVGIQSDCLTLGFVWGLLFLESNPVSGSRSQNSESSALRASANCASLCREASASASWHRHGGPLLWGPQLLFPRELCPSQPQGSNLFTTLSPCFWGFGWCLLNSFWRTSTPIPQQLQLS